MTSLLSHRIEQVRVSPTLHVTSMAKALKAQGQDVISLSVGEPDFNTPDHILSAAQLAMQQGDTKYTAVDGTPALKEAICRKLKRENNLDYALSEIAVSQGLKFTLYAAFMASVNPGDEVIVVAPYWPSYYDMIKLCGGVPVVVPASALKDLTPHITQKTKWVLLNSPTNPSGAVLSKSLYKAIEKALLKAPHVHVMSDEIYEHILFDGKTFVSFPEACPDLKNRTLILNGVSKAYAMTGWRIGYAAGPENLIKAIAKLQSQSTSSPCSISQSASITALDESEAFLKKAQNLYQQRRDIMIKALKTVPHITFSPPQGTFYCFINVEKLLGRTTPEGTHLKTDIDLAAHLLKTALVATVPGTAFGQEGYLRLSFAVAEDRIQEACSRLKKACAQLVI